MILLGSILLISSIPSAGEPRSTINNRVKKSDLSVLECSQNKTGLRYKAADDTSKKDKSSYFERQEPMIKSGRVPFYGTWADYFSSYLKINADSTFQYSWGYDWKGSWTTGKWTRKKDTFYFRSMPVYDTLRFAGPNNALADSLVPARFPEPRVITEMPDSDEILLIRQNAHPMPDRLCFYRNKFFLMDREGNLMKAKIPSIYMGKKNPLFRTWYFREKRFNLNYFDSVYYDKAIKRRFKIGTGIAVMLQPIPGYRVVGSFGFVFSPEYIFDRKDKSWLSLGMPLTTGFSPLNDSISIDLKLGIMVNLPLVLNYHVELGSLKEGGSRFGYFAGGGIAYHYHYYTAVNAYESIVQQVNGFGPVVNAGIRLSLKKYRIHNIEFRVSYMKMMVASRPDVLGISYIINF